MKNIARLCEATAREAGMKRQRRRMVDAKRAFAKVLRPKITTNHRLESNGFYIEIDLAGADKETVELEMGTYGLSVRAEGDKVRYNGNCELGYNIIPEKTKAHYDNGVLYVHLPIKEKNLSGTQIEIVTT